MKKLYSILHAVMLVSIVGTAIFLILSPDRVPIHWNAAGEIDGMGSKYVFLFAPLISLVTYALFLLAAGSQRNYGEAANERIIVYAGIGTLIFITVEHGQRHCLAEDPAFRRNRLGHRRTRLDSPCAVPFGTVACCRRHGGLRFSGGGEHHGLAALLSG